VSAGSAAIIRAPMELIALPVFADNCLRMLQAGAGARAILGKRDIRARIAGCEQERARGLPAPRSTIVVPVFAALHE
jgi:hypothetical protein